MKRRDVLAIFNRGRISRRALARVDVSRVALSAEVQTNFLPRTMGSMSLRPGTAFIGRTRNDAAGVYIPFVFSVSDYAALELTPNVIRVLDGAASLVSRVAVSSTIANGTFASDLASWTDADDVGAASTWATGGYLQMLGTGYSSARRRQGLVISGGDAAKMHALRIVVARGPVTLRVGTTGGADDLVPETVLRTGTHSIAFTPGGTAAVVEFSSARSFPVLVDSIAVEAAGALELPTPWGADDLPRLRHCQSGDVVFVACGCRQQRRIERRANNSWSVCLYEPEDGPFQTESVSGTRIAASGLSGSVTLTSNRPLFRPGHVGALFSITSNGQKVSAAISGEDTFSDPIRVTGISTGRTFTLSITGTWTGTVSIQRSIGEPGAWVTVLSYTGNITTPYSDGLDNVVAYYRIGMSAGAHSSGTADVDLEYAVGSITGTARVTAVASATSATAVVLKALGGTAATDIWAEGAWSDVSGWPTATALYEGRLWWAGRGRVWGSISDAFESFDPEFEGDAGPINKPLGGDLVDVINWLLPLQRLIAGGGGAEHSIRSTTFDEPLTPSNFNVKQPSRQGSSAVAAAAGDGRGWFAQRSGARFYELSFQSDQADYQATDMTALVPEICEAGIRRIVVQRQPDTRVHVVLADGTVALLVRDPAEDVIGWCNYKTEGAIEDVCVLPGETEDTVLLMVARTIDGETVRTHERFALESECRGAAMCKLADAHVAHDGEAITTLSGLDHLEGETIVIWADGDDRGTAVVDGGEIALGGSYTKVCAGLGYEATYKSAKFSAQTSLGVTLTQRSRVQHIGLILADTHRKGLEYGPSFDVLDEMPDIEAGAATSGVHEAYDYGMVEFPGEWTPDARLCLRAAAPRPCTVMGAALAIDTVDKA